MSAVDDRPIEGPDDDDWLIVPNWDRFQHYTDRNPPWIKLYTKLLSNPDFLHLTLVERGLLMTLWVAYASASGQLRVKQLRTCVRARYGTNTLISLNRAGFLYWSASKPLAAVLAAKKEKEKEKEKESPYPLTSNEALRRLRLDAFETIAASWNGGSGEDFAKAIEALERKLKVRLPFADREALWDEVLRRERKRRAT